MYDASVYDASVYDASVYYASVYYVSMYNARMVVVEFFNMFGEVALHLHVSPQVKGKAIERHPDCASRRLRSHKMVKLCWSPFQQLYGHSVNCALKLTDVNCMPLEVHCNALQLAEVKDKAVKIHPRAEAVVS